MRPPRPDRRCPRHERRTRPRTPTPGQGTPPPRSISTRPVPWTLLAIPCARRAAWMPVIDSGDKLPAAKTLLRIRLLHLADKRVRLRDRGFHVLDQAPDLTLDLGDIPLQGCDRPGVEVVLQEQHLILERITSTPG